MKTRNIKKNKDGGSCFIKLYRTSSKQSPEYSKGYAILFTVIVVSIISMISMGLANTALKQMILSGVARDSTTAFYEADLGAECTMYGDYNSYTIPFPATVGATSSWNCAGHSLVITKVSDFSYTINPDGASSTGTGKCFRATITKTNVGAYVETTALIKGYNICNTSNLRTVERTLKITY